MVLMQLRLLAALLTHSACALHLSLFAPSSLQFSLGWMMYRCDYARSHNQEVVLRIKLSWAALQRILSAAVGSTWAPRLHPTKAEWTAAMANSSVRFQWDPERNLRIEKLGNGQRALQLGLAKDVAAQFACDPQWILSIEDCTAQVRAIKAAIDAGEPLPAVPLEREYVIEDAALRKSLAMDLSHADEDHGPPAPVRKAKGQRNGQDAGHGIPDQARSAASADAAAQADAGGSVSSSSSSS